MTNYNIWGQTSLMIQRLEDKREHFLALCAVAQREVHRIDHSIETLKQVKGELKEAEGYLNEVRAKINERTRKREALQEEVNELRSTKGITLAAKSFTDGSFSTTKSQRSSAPPAPHHPERTRLTPYSSRQSSVANSQDDNKSAAPEKTEGTTSN
jgi:hypothetical protein